MTRLSAVLLVALWQMPAGAQPAASPELLLDQYTATGDKALIERCRSMITDLPRTNRSRLLEARLLLATDNPKSALAAAVAVNRDIPDELDTYGVIVDASLLLGDLNKAETAAQWMLNLRPEDFRSLMRGAAVREAIQDLEGAGQMLIDAFAHTSRADTPNRAAIAVSLARVTLRRGKSQEAARLIAQVEALVPGYRPAALLKLELEKK